VSFNCPDPYRVTRGRLGTARSLHGNNGIFVIPSPNPKSHILFTVVASDGIGWEHVSVSTKERCPTWNEMCFIKATFWGPEDCVVQFHPPQAQYVNNHKYALHLWRPVAVDLPFPPPILVGLVGGEL